jgi:hypothetical protein
MFHYKIRNVKKTKKRFFLKSRFVFLIHIKESLKTSFSLKKVFFFNLLKCAGLLAQIGKNTKKMFGMEFLALQKFDSELP